MPIKLKTVVVGAAAVGVGAAALGLGTLALTTSAGAGPAASPSRLGATVVPAATDVGPTIPRVALLSARLTAAPTLSTVQERAAFAISTRVTALDRALARVNGQKDLGPDQAPLAQRLQGDATGLQQLGQKIAGDTVLATAEADRSSLYTSYRILALVIPTVRLEIRADTITNADVPRLSKESSALGARVRAADQGQVAPLFSDLNAQISAAKSAAAGVPATVAADTAAQWNANHQLLAGPAASVKSARSDVAKARSDVRQIRADLRASRGS